MDKKLNGIFREWMKVDAADPAAPPIVWGHCIVHLSHPEFCGAVLHTSGVLSITEFETFRIAETRNSFYALLGPQLHMPADGATDPMNYVAQNLRPAERTDLYVNAALNADPNCPVCHGAGVYRYSDQTLAICQSCCKHNQGWWKLEGAYGADNGRWACKIGCGEIVDEPPPALEFLPRAQL